MTAATSITRAHQILSGRIDAALAPLGLNFSRFEVLALLSFTKEGELPLGKVGDRLQVHPGVGHQHGQSARGRRARRARKPHPTDRRTTLAVLTRRGRRRRAERAAVALAEIEFGVAGLSRPARRSVDAAILELWAAAGDFA